MDNNEQHTTQPAFRPERRDDETAFERDDDQTAVERRDDETAKRPGDVLGLSDADPSVEIPRATDDRSPSHVSDEPATRRRSALQRTPGATGIDMGAGGTGTDIEAPSIRRPNPTR
jgi:hypothetical protein